MNDIVKVIHSTLEQYECIYIHNKDKSFYMEIEPRKEVLTLLNGRYKAFFFARIGKKDGRDQAIILLNEAPLQDW